MMMVHVITLAMVFAGEPASPPQKAAAPACIATTLLDKKHKVLQRNLEKAIAESSLAKYVQKGRLTVALVDLSRAGESYYAGINDDESM